MMRYTLLLLAACVTAIAAGAVEPSPLWTAYQAAPDTHANLPNCSYAGYRNGDVPLPNPTTNIIHVKSAPYLAKGDGATDDTTAIRNAISAVGGSGGVVYFPDGDYVISGVLFVHKNGTVLRGQSRRGAAALYQTASHGLRHQLSARRSA